VKRRRLAGHSGNSVPATKGVKGAQRAVGRPLDSCGSGHDRFFKQNNKCPMRTLTFDIHRAQRSLDIGSLDGRWGGWSDLGLVGRR